MRHYYTVDAIRDAEAPLLASLPDGALMPSYSGIRPKIVPPSVAVQDFLIQGSAVHGVRGLINLFGIESPGLTASLALADHVREMAEAG